MIEGLVQIGYVTTGHSAFNDLVWKTLEDMDKKLGIRRPRLYGPGASTYRMDSLDFWHYLPAMLMAGAMIIGNDWETDSDDGGYTLYINENVLSVEDFCHRLRMDQCIDNPPAPAPTRTLWRPEDAGFAPLEGEEERRELLNLVPKTQTSTLAGYFCDTIRTMKTEGEMEISPETIVTALADKSAALDRKYGKADPSTTQGVFSKFLSDHPEKTKKVAAYYIAWMLLPDQERQARKEAVSRHYIIQNR